MGENKFVKSKFSRRRLESEIVSTAVEGSESDVIEHVLEHISSPFRWELLDESAARLVPPFHDNRTNEKLS